MNERGHPYPLSEPATSPFLQLEKYLRERGISPPPTGTEAVEDLDSRYVFPCEPNTERSFYGCFAGRK
jgi:hypothetical protein